MLKATKIRLYPNKEQCQKLSFQFGAMRWVYNFALSWRSSAFKDEGKSISKFETIKHLRVLKRREETDWLKQADSQCLQQSLMNLDNGFKRFFKKQGRYPRFKNKYGKQSLSYPQRVKLNEGNLYLPKVGNVRAIFHREISGIIKTVTISKTPTGKYFAWVLVDDGVQARESVTALTEDEVLGLDMGLTHLATDSNGAKIANPRFLKRATANLRRKQKALSRKKKGSANRNKMRVLVALAHEKTANTRNDFQHKLSRHWVDENQAICVETLKVKNMLKNRRLSKHIADASWGELICKLEYKALWAGKYLVKIDQWYPSSKTCSVCHNKVNDMPLSVRQWTCDSCSTQHDREGNASVNIKQQGIMKLKAEGHSVSACGGCRKTGILPGVAMEARSPFLFKGGEQVTGYPSP